MSGGSFDYLGLSSDLDDLLAKIPQLERMRDELAARGARDAALETGHLLATLAQWEVLARIACERLSPVWKAVEWNASGDWGPDRLDAALAEYRAP
jgi:hypothetical protein